MGNGNILILTAEPEKAAESAGYDVIASSPDRPLKPEVEVCLAKTGCSSLEENSG
jgi:hypothetical protein